MTEPLVERCADCGRIVYERGARHMIEAARTEDGASPVDEYLNGLLTSGKAKDEERLASILVRFESFARRGTLEIPRELNELQDGLWEFKAGTDRVPFFYLAESESNALRATHGFIKRQLRTPRKEINWAKRIRKEDLAS
ncbi:MULTISPECIES: type II toxin-antitoxin system RelE/ParE family toxin [unclassified Streptomyces]|uniref:type II toxin-antitoxin system RelE/ParE family toxin n=1 Tax=unclassified Streptomyces TaxID=2593676 RepID=UPI00332928FE